MRKLIKYVLYIIIISAIVGVYGFYALLIWGKHEPHAPLMEISEEKICNAKAYDIVKTITTKNGIIEEITNYIRIKEPMLIIGNVWHDNNAEKSIKIYQGKWRKGNYLEIIK